MRISCLVYRVRSSGCVAILALSILLVACGNGSALIDAPRYLAEPRSIAELRMQDIGAVTVTVMVDNQVVVDNVSVAENETQVTLDASLFSSEFNNLSVQFWLEPFAVGFQNTPRLMASANVVIPYTGPGGTVQLPPLEYRYTDSDSDTLADSLEWQIQPPDIDGDLLPNSEDDDSDADGLKDNVDFTPYGDAYPVQSVDSLVLLPIVVPDSSSNRLPLTFGSSAISEIQQIQDSPLALPLGVTNDWSFVTADLPPSGQTQLYPWHVLDIESHIRTQCTDWRIAIDTSSLEAKLSGSALLYFRRFDSGPVLLPLGNGTIDNLSSIAVQTPATAEAASRAVDINDGLRLLFVSPWTTGWLTLWSEAGFAGQSCSVNLSRALF